MKSLINFFVKVGNLRKVLRRGWVLIGAKEPASVLDHSFRLAIMAWVLGQQSGKEIDINRLIKMALVHDLCELYAGDVTPYDLAGLPEDETKWPELFDKWPRSSQKQKQENNTWKCEQEDKSLQSILKDLPVGLKQEVYGFWKEYEKGITPEARFLKQLNRLETLLQALEYGRENKKTPYKSWWIGTKELVDDPFLIKLMEGFEKEFPLGENKQE